MARPTVPHCKECKHLEDGRVRGNMYGFWICGFGMKRRFMSGQEVRTCPKWCPLRISGFVSTAAASASHSHR